METHRQKTISGFVWSAVGQVGTEVSKLVVGILLMRLLGPEEFGLIAEILVFTGLANIVLEFGFAEALIQQKEVTETDWSTIFWVNVGVGLILALAMLVSAPFISRFYEEPQLLPMAQVLSGVFLFQSLTIVQRTRLTKELKFKQLAQVDIAGFVGSGLMAVIAAFSGLGVWSLVIQHMSRSMIQGAYLWWIGNWKPILEFSKDSIKKATGFSVLMFLKRVMGHIAMNVDSLLVGKVLGKETLGLYNRGFFFMMLPVNSITNVITRVMFPSLSAIQENPKEVTRVFTNMLGVVSFIVFPFMVALFLLAESVVIIFLGQEWADMIPFLQVFSILGITATLSRLTVIPVMSMGRKDLLSRVIFIEKPIQILAIIIGINWGIWGILYANIISSIFILGLKFDWAGKSINTTAITLFRVIIPPLLLTLATGVLLYLTQLILQQYLATDSIPYFVLSSGLYALYFLTLGFVFKSKELTLFLGLLRSLKDRFSSDSK